MGDLDADAASGDGGLVPDGAESCAVVGPLLIFVKYAIIALLIPLYVVSVKELRWLCLVIAFSVGLVGFRFGVFGLRAGGIHFEDGLGGFMSDNNTLAVALLMGLPFIWYGRELVEKRWMKMVAYLFLFTNVATIVMTHSRGALLSRWRSSAWCRRSTRGIS